MAFSQKEPNSLNPARRYPAGRWPGWCAGLLGLVLLTGCPQTSPPPPPPPLATDHELHFDMRYYDSIEMTPRSPHTERELAIFQQLQRLRMTKPHRRDDKVIPPPKYAKDSVYETYSDGRPALGFANQAEELADIYRKIDSLKVLEHIPLTPH